MLNKDEILKILKDKLNLHPLRVHNIYLFGSQVYGTATEKSDYDYVVVANASVRSVEYNFRYLNNELNIHIWTPDYFMERLQWNDPKVIECLLYSLKNPILEKIDYKPKINKAKYRHAVSHISSNSWVKAKKKIYQGDIYIGQKSLYHSLRIPMYAIQVMKYKDIIDWECANKYWEEIKDIKGWDILKDKFQPIRNKIMTEFRELCPKD